MEVLEKRLELTGATETGWVIDMGTISGSGVAKPAAGRRQYISSPTLRVKLLHEDAEKPTRAHDGDAGLDLRAVHTYVIEEGITKVRTGIGVEIPYGYVGLLFIRSSIATKRGLELANSVGVIDAHYRGELIVALKNEGNEPVTIRKGERIAQLVISPILLPTVEVVDELSETERGEGGFGSTGTK